MSDAERTSLRELAALFFRLGATSFGGPAVHVAMMRDEFVTRRKWLTDADFIDLMGAANLIPGPTSTEVATHVGYRRCGWPGLFVAGLSFLLPAVLSTMAVGWAYVRFGSVPELGWALYGIKPVVLAVVLQALWGLYRSAVRSWPLRLLSAAAVGASLLGMGEVAVLLATGLAVMALQATRRTQPLPALAPLENLPQWPPGLAAAGATGGVALGLTPSFLAIFLVFLKIGSVLFGSGYVLLAFLRADLVQRLHWLTESQLLDAVAVGQLTPGPLFSTATFVGFLLAGPSGAVAATAGVFLPAFAFVAVSIPVLPRLRRSPYTAAFLDGVNAASLALMAVVTFQLGRGVLTDIPSVLLALAAAVCLVRFRWGSGWLVLAGAAAGAALRALHLA